MTTIRDFISAGCTQTELPELRRDLAMAMLDRFEHHYREHHTNYDPDAVWEMADVVIATLMSRAIGVPVKAVFHPSTIGPAQFHIGIEG